MPEKIKNGFIEADNCSDPFSYCGEHIEALSVCDQDQEKIQEKFVVAKATPETMSEKTVFDKGKTANDLSDSMGIR